MRDPEEEDSGVQVGGDAYGTVRVSPRRDAQVRQGSAFPATRTVPRRCALVRGPGRFRSLVGADQLRDDQIKAVDAGVAGVAVHAAP